MPIALTLHPRQSLGRRHGSLDACLLRLNLAGDRSGGCVHIARTGREHGYPVHIPAEPLTQVCDTFDLLAYASYRELHTSNSTTMQCGHPENTDRSSLADLDVFPAEIGMRRVFAASFAYSEFVVLESDFDSIGESMTDGLLRSGGGGVFSDHSITKAAPWYFAIMEGKPLPFFIGVSLSEPQ